MAYRLGYEPAKIICMLAPSWALWLVLTNTLPRAPALVGIVCGLKQFTSQPCHATRRPGREQPVRAGRVVILKLVAVVAISIDRFSNNDLQSLMVLFG